MDWKLVGTAFAVLFLAELGDKTQLAVFTLAASHKAPGTVFLGAAAALVLVTLIGAYLGGFVSTYVPPKAMHVGAGSLFIVLGGLLLWDALR